MNKKSILKTTAVGVISIVLTMITIISVPLFHDSEAHAAGTVSADDLYKKALVVGLKTCYSSTYMNDTVNASGVTVSKLLKSAGKTDGKIIVPTYVGNTLKDSDMSCENILAGYSGSGGVAKSVFAAFGKPAFSSSATGTNLVSLGYSPVASENAAPTGNYEVKVSFDYFKITNGSAGAKTNGYYVITLDSNGTEVSNTANSCYTYSTNSAWPCVSATPNSFWVQDGQLYGNIEVHGAMNGIYPTIGNGVAITLLGTGQPNITYTGALTCDGYVSDEQDVAYSCGTDGTIYKLSNFKATTTFKEDTSQVTSSAQYELKNKSFASAAATLRLYLGASNYADFNDNDKKSLYYDHYILSVLRDSTNGTTYVDNSSCMDSLTSEAQNGSDYYLPSGGKWCKLVGSENATVKKNPADNDYKFAIISSTSSMKKTSGTKAAAFQEVVRELMKISNSIDITDTQDIADEVGNITDPGTDPGGNADPDDGENAATPTCFNSAGSLGWILCPVLEILSSAVEGIYDNVIVTQFLEIDASFMAADSSGSVYKGWQDFRNFANIIFAILFIIVILAQVTGIGISNYNVKKILPRLIMTVVLVNISFILCQLAVDLSNILGFQLKKFFVDLAGDTVVTVGGFVGNIGSALTSTLVTGGLIAGGIYAASLTWEFWLIPLLLFLLGIIVSIFFFAIILGVRKAGILILIVLAPVAVVCYTLPNTKRFFDRWFKLFSSLLLVYPICGLLMGGGQYASTLLLGAAGGDDVGFFMALVAMLVQVVPFFLIPSLVKGSLAAMGSLGMKISNFGSRVSGGLQRGIRGSKGVREAERRLSMQNAERSFNRLNRRIQNREDSGRRVGAGLRHRRSAAAARYNRMAYEDIRAGGTQQLLAEGTMARENEELAARNKQMDQDISARQSWYANNSEFSDEQSLGNEYEKVLNDFIASPNDRDLEVKVKALQNILSETDEGRSQIQNRMISAMMNSANVSRLENGKETGLSKAASYLSTGKLGATYKAKNRSMFSMLGDLSRKQYDMGTQEMRDGQGNIITDPSTGQAQHHRFDRIVSGTDAQGNDIFRYRSSYYDGSGLASYTAETLAGADEGAINRITESIDSGNISGASLQAIAETASEALNSDTVRVQPKIAQKLRQIERAGYASSPSLFARASDASLGDIASRIQSGEIKDTTSSPELTRIALSAQSALRDPAALHSPETAERLNQILTAAGAKGAVDTATGSHFRAVDSASIKIRGRETPKLRQAAPVPQGWTENGIWVGGGTGPTKRQQIAYEQWAKHAAEVEIHNAQINNPPTPPPNP